MFGTKFDSVLDPDGRVRVVQYTADKAHGFQAKVITDGHVIHHPQHGPSDHHDDGGYRHPAVPYRPPAPAPPPPLPKPHEHPNASSGGDGGGGEGDDDEDEYGSNESGNNDDDDGEYEGGDDEGDEDGDEDYY